MSARTLLPLIVSAAFKVVMSLIGVINTSRKVWRFFRVMVMPSALCALALIYPYGWLIGQCGRIINDRLLSYATQVYANQHTSPATKSVLVSIATLVENTRLAGLSVTLFIAIVAMCVNLGARAARRTAWFNIHKTNRVIKASNWTIWLATLVASMAFMVVIQAA